MSDEAIFTKAMMPTPLRWSGARRWLNSWRLVRTYDGEVCVEWYRRRNGSTVITRVGRCDLHGIAA